MWSWEDAAPSEADREPGQWEESIKIIDQSQARTHLAKVLNHSLEGFPLRWVGDSVKIDCTLVTAVVEDIESLLIN